MEQDIVIIEDNPPITREWIPSFWIACGKTYPTQNTPDFILAACKELLAIPSQYSQYTPNPCTSVIELLAMSDIPLQSHTLVTPIPKATFSTLEPNKDFVNIRK